MTLYKHTRTVSMILRKDSVRIVKKMYSNGKPHIPFQKLVKVDYSFN